MHSPRSHKIFSKLLEDHGKLRKKSPGQISMPPHLVSFIHWVNQWSSTNFQTGSRLKISPNLRSQSYRQIYSRKGHRARGPVMASSSLQTLSQSPLQSRMLSSGWIRTLERQRRKPHFHLLTSVLGVCRTEEITVKTLASPI